LWSRLSRTVLPRNSRIVGNTEITRSSNLNFGAVVLEKWGFRKLHLLTRRLSGKLPITRAVSTGRCNARLQFTRRRFKAQGLSRALIEAQSYLVEIGLRVDG
jgi:hypothetical protein